MDYVKINASTIDRWVEEGWEWGRPITHEAYLRAAKGEWQVLLTPVKPVPREWLGELRGKRILGLASGGAQQMPVFAAQGALVTVMDISERQLESERLCAEREGYEITIIRGDMTQPLPFEDNSFDIIFHPVSNVYIHDVRPVWKECARILKPGGVLLSGLDNGINFIADDEEKCIIHHLPFDPLKDPDQMAFLQKSDCGVQFSHTAEEQLAGQLEAGLTLTALYEDTNGCGRLHELGIPSFWATRAVKPAGQAARSVDWASVIEELEAITMDVRYPQSLLANASAYLNEQLDRINWCGFYLYRDGKLILGPFQGKLACEEIEAGHGVCGTAVQRNETVLVPDVRLFPGHIPCDSASLSEIVIPIRLNGSLFGVLDIDSPVLSRFDTQDKAGLETAIQVLEKALERIEKGEKDHV